MSLLQSGEGVCPRGPMCRQARGLCASQTEPAKMQRQMRSPGGEAVQHGWRTVRQQCLQASKNRLVMAAGEVRRGAGRQSAERVVAPRSRTHEQQQPSRLKVRDGGDFWTRGPPSWFSRTRQQKRRYPTACPAPPCLAVLPAERGRQPILGGAQATAEVPP